MSLKVSESQELYDLRFKPDSQKSCTFFNFIKISAKATNNFSEIKQNEE